MSFLSRLLPKPEPTPRDGFLTYVAHGDKVWGNSIAFRAQEDDELDVHGWLSRAPFPREGDVVLVEMQSGKWARYLFTETKTVWGVGDMFNAKAVFLDYAEAAPQTDRVDEFISADQMSRMFRT